MARKSNDKICFKVNGEAHELPDNADMRDSLNDYLRNNLNLKGTKFMCGEGGCGLCVVNVKEKHPITNENVTYAVNSCLVSPFSCHDKEITTIEGLGSRSRGYHPIQKRLSSFNGSQCGYCSPGWVMSMYSALETEGKNLTMDKVENYFGSNLCRCTGYRPILDAMKSFASDANLKIKQQISDIEDIDKWKSCKKTGSACTTTCEDFHLEDEYCIINALEITKQPIYNNKKIEISHLERKWFKVYSLQQLFEIFENEGTDSYQLLAGNTAKGVYRTILPTILIDISHIDELRNYSIGTNLTLGANMTLTEAMNIFNELSNNNFYFLYTKILADHLSLVAHYPVRNIGTIAGNLSIKHEHPEFPSDLFLLLEVIGAAVAISDQRSKITVNLRDYLKMDMKGKVIININLPPMASNHIFKTFKITPRAQNAHAIINAGFLITLKTDGCIESAKIVYGNISKEFTHAINTEKILTGKIFYKDETVRLAIQMLNQEIYPTFEYAEPSVEYRKKLALALYYKFCLSVLPPTLIDQRYISGGSMINRPLSSGKQIFDTKRTNYPLNEPITKLEADNQCSGEAKYVNDIDKIPGELRATFVTSTIHRGILVNIDATEALKIAGVKAVLTASDIPGANTFTPLSIPATITEEEVLVEVGKKVKFYGQPIAVIVADNEHALTEAALLVKITYKDVTAKPILTIQEALTADPKEQRIVNDMVTERTRRGNNIKTVLKGTFDVKSQYHFHTENQTCVCVPIEDGMDVFASTQWMDQVNAAVAGLLNMHENSINVIVRRLGGGFGAKVSRSTQIACGCALAAWKLNKPVRFVMSLEMNMTSVGKKHSTFANYEVGVDENGKIQYLDNTFYHDNGCSLNETLSVQFLLPAFPNCYDSSTWTISANSVLTDTPSTTFFRAPGLSLSI